MTSSPESARPVTRRALRERTRIESNDETTPAPSAAAQPLVVDAAVTQAVMSGARGRDTETTARSGDPAQIAADTDTVAVDDDERAPVTAPFTLASMFAEETADADDDDLDATRPVAIIRSERHRPADEEQDEQHEDADDGAVPATWADEKRPPTALTWLDPSTVTAASARQTTTAPDLFSGARLVPGWLRPRVLVPLGFVAALCGAYVATTLLWPLNSVTPTVQAVDVAIEPAAAGTAAWPGTGSAAVAVQGIAPLASTTERDEIASITKVASTLMVLDELPLKVGEQGPSFEFTYSDARDYWSYRRSNQSSLDVPVGGSLTEYQMLQGVLLGSANNYIDRLSDELWGSDREFAEASEKWLSDRGITGVSLVTPSGFDEDNVATPSGLIQLGELAMKNPVFAEIVGTRSAEIPDVGTVTNTNKMLDDEGVIGVKTGTLSHWNLLTAKDIKVGDTSVRLFTAVLGQDSNKDRLAVTRQLFAGVEKSLAEQPVSVPKGTVVGHVTTEWGDKIAVVTDADAKVVLWNGATASATTKFALGEKSAAGAKVGTLSAEGPINSAGTSVSLASEVTAPTIWWRLTHPLELFGLSKS